MSSMEYWHWMAFGVALAIVELFIPSAFFLGMGLAAFVVGVVMWAGIGIAWEGQIFLFAVLSLVTIVVLRRYLKTRPIETDQPLLNLRGHQYVGRDFTLHEPIVNGQGKIRVDDSIWKVVGRDCPAGSLVSVTGVDGVVLQVEPKSGQ